MIRQTIVLTETAYSLAIPKEWIGKSVTIVYDKEWLQEKQITTPMPQKQKQSSFFDDCRVDLSTGLQFSF